MTPPPHPPRDDEPTAPGFDERPPTIRPVSHVDLHQTNRKIAAIEREQLLFESKVSTSIPGADFAQHLRDHEEMMERRIESRRTWASIRHGFLAGVAIAIAIGAWTMLYNYVAGMH